MYVDLTPAWREMVQLLESRKDELGLVVVSPKDKARILGVNPLTRQYRDIVTTVGQLAVMLESHRVGYMSSGQTGTGVVMTDTDRDQVDAGAEEVTKKCRQLIAKFRNDLGSLDTNSSTQEHLSEVAAGLDRYLKTVVQIHSNMRAVRVQRQLEHKQLSRLEVKSRESRTREGESTAASAVNQHDMVDLQEKAVAAAAQAASTWESSEDEEMTQEEAQQLELENEELMDQLNNLTDSVQQVHHKVVKIAELQEIFTEKVLQQADDIDRLHLDTVAATENITSGNEEVRQAIQKNASYRVYILFVLLVFSFSLLFLDWYND